MDLNENIDDVLSRYYRLVITTISYIIALTFVLMYNIYMQLKVYQPLWFRFWCMYVLLQLALLRSTMQRQTLYLWLMFLMYTSTSIIFASSVIIYMCLHRRLYQKIPWSTSFVPIWFMGTFVLEIGLFYTLYCMRRFFHRNEFDDLDDSD